MEHAVKLRSGGNVLECGLWSFCIRSVCVMKHTHMYNEPCVDTTGIPTDGIAFSGYVPGAILGGLRAVACSSLASLLSLDLLF